MTQSLGHGVHAHNRAMRHSQRTLGPRAAEYLSKQDKQMIRQTYIDRGERIGALGGSVVGMGVSLGTLKFLRNKTLDKVKRARMYGAQKEPLYRVLGFLPGFGLGSYAGRRVGKSYANKKIDRIERRHSRGLRVPSKRSLLPHVYEERSREDTVDKLSDRVGGTLTAKTPPMTARVADDYAPVVGRYLAGGSLSRSELRKQPPLVRDAHKISGAFRKAHKEVGFKRKARTLGRELRDRSPNYSARIPVMTGAALGLGHTAVQTSRKGWSGFNPIRDTAIGAGAGYLAHRAMKNLADPKTRHKVASHYNRGVQKWRQKPEIVRRNAQRFGVSAPVGGAVMLATGNPFLAIPAGQVAGHMASKIDPRRIKKRRFRE